MSLRCLSVIFLFCFGLQAQNLVTNHQLLWQISGKGLKKPSYLFGSYHSNDPRVFHMSDSTYSALYQAEAIVLETDIYQLFLDYDMRTKEVSLKFDSNGKPFTSSNKATETRYGSEDGRPQFLDLYFQQIAYNSGKKFYPLEKIEDQLEALEFVYDRSNAQKSLEQLKIVQDNMMTAYLRGDIDYLRNLIQHEMNESKASFERLIIKRNYVMADGIDSLAKKNSLFIAIGAGHLAGDEGVIQLLRKKGFQVRQVAATYSDQKSEFEKKITQFYHYDYHNPKLKFKAIFGGKPVLDTNATYFRLMYQEMGQGNTFIIEVEELLDTKLKDYASDVINSPDNSSISEIMHQGAIPAYEGIGYEFGAGLCWKRVFAVDGKLVKLICYGGNKFMNSNRPKNFFEKVIFEEKK